MALRMLKILTAAGMIFLSFLTAIHSHAQQTIEYSIKGLPDGKAWLLLTRGGTHILLDSADVHNGMIRFTLPEDIETGMYRISFADSLYTDVILNRENLRMENNMSDLFGNLRIIESEENRIYYDYWTQIKTTEDSIALIAQLGNAIYEINGRVFTPELDSMRQLVLGMQKRADEYTRSLVKTSPGMFVRKILLAYLTPDWEEYKAKEGAAKYRNKFDFLREHYFDNIDFGDSLLLNSEVFYVTATDYILTYADPPSTENYIAATSFILEKARQNKPVLNYLLTLFMNTFEGSEWEDVWAYLVTEWYLNQEGCDNDSLQQNLAKRLEYVKLLKPGNKAPDISMKDVSGRVASLYSLKNPLVLLMFWSPDCPHCEAAMPEIKKMYDSYHKSGFEIFAVSVTTDKSGWQKAVDQNGLYWINVCDFKGYQSPELEKYNVHQTPLYFLVDGDKTIRGRPNTSDALQEMLKQWFER
jgi:peroxiredoxin